jgi:hypothetical protein
MLLSPKQDELKAQIKTVILRDSEDFFDELEDLAVLQNTIRIACEFSDFLKGTDVTIYFPWFLSLLWFRKLFIRE